MFDSEKKSMTYSCQLVTITSIAGYEGRLFDEIIVHSLAPVACITLLKPFASIFVNMPHV